MKPHLLLALFAWLLAVANARALTESASNVKPVHYVFGISPFLDKSVKDNVYRQIVRFVLEDLPLNSSLAVYDAYHIRSITQITVPDLRAFQSGKTRANQFKDEVQKVREFLAATPRNPDTNHFDFSNAIRLPQFMDFVAEHAPKDAVTLLLGSPLYLDAKEPGFSMANGYFPSDGHLLAGRDRSVYGLKTREGALNGVVVHLAYFGDPWVSGVHEEKIARFWSLYLKGQGATLATFNGDLATAFAALKSDAPAGVRSARYELDRDAAKVEMLRITRDSGAADWITREDLPRTQHGPPSVTRGPMKIGIRWKGNLDLDLYARPAPGAQTLYFEETRSPEGYYFKDHRSSPEREFEFIEFEQPVDVREVQARINFYEGELDHSANGEVRVEFDGRIYSAPFSLRASHGNKGRDGQSQRDFWTTIDIPKLLKLE